MSFYVFRFILCLAEYAHIKFMSCLTILLFFGGWLGLSFGFKVAFFVFVFVFFFYGHKYLFLGFDMTNEWSYYERGICPLVWGLFFLLLGMPL